MTGTAVAEVLRAGAWIGAVRPHDRLDLTDALREKPETVTFDLLPDRPGVHPERRIRADGLQDGAELAVTGPWPAAPAGRRWHATVRVADGRPAVTG